MSIHTHQYFRQAGFSLVEVMVGLVIGMISVLAIMQVFSLSEGQRRTTSGAGDAQSSGTLALTQIQRDLRQSGQGIAAQRILGCSLTLRAGVTLSQLGPLTINHASIPAGDGGSDTLLVIYGGAWGSPEGTGVSAQPATDRYAVSAATSFVVNDWIIAAVQNRPSTCTLAADVVKARDTAAGTITATTGLSSMANGTLYNLGLTPTVMAYAVRAGNLTACNLMSSDCLTASKATDASVWVPVASNIVALRAQYGRDASSPMDAIVDTYDQTSPTTACQWTRLSAARIALVARSIQYEKTEVTAAAPTWSGSSSSTPVAFDLTGFGNWKHYRYKVFETTVPLRNMAWLGVQSGC